MVSRYIKMLGYEDTIQLLEYNDRPLTPSLRVNLLKINPKNLIKRLQAKGFKLEAVNKIPYAYKVLHEPQNLGSLHEFLQGYYHLQNIASMLPPLLLAPSSKDMVIDMCAAPGSKSTQLASIMKNKGRLLLIEKDFKRLKALNANVRRLGVYNSITLNMDASKIGQLGIKADKILLDAPCTGEGLIRQDPSRKTSRTPKDLKKMANVQKKLLLSGVNALKSGGSLLYSTCSIAPEENEFVVDDVLKKNPNMHVIKLEEDFGMKGFTEMFGKSLNSELVNAQRIYPHIHNTIGFFICLLKKQ
jgi:NOL1/NOP2/sun family putative RNA methylase